jgi:hypothetical protein
MDVIARIAMGQRESTLFASPYLDVVKRYIDIPAANAIAILSNTMPFLMPAITFIGKHMSLSVFADRNRLTNAIREAVEKRRRQRVRMVDSSS